MLRQVLSGGFRILLESMEKPVRAEPVEACSRNLRDEQKCCGCLSICAALPFDRLRANGSFKCINTILRTFAPRTLFFLHQPSKLIHK